MSKSYISSGTHRLDNEEKQRIADNDIEAGQHDTLAGLEKSSSNAGSQSYVDAGAGGFPDVEPGWRAGMMRWAGRLRMEQRGIERVPDDERHESGEWALLNVATLWLSANMTVSTFAIGVLSQTAFELSAADSMLVVVFFNLLAAPSVCFFSTFGPQFGLRQLVLSRYWFGWWGVKIVSVLNILAMIGWSAVNTVVGAELIHAVNSDVPGFAGVLVLGSGTLLVCLFGYRVVHAYELYSWIPSTIVFLIVLGVFAHSGDFRSLPMGTGTSELGSVLSFGSVVYGYSAAWGTYAADYTVYQPATRSRRKVFLWTGFGLILPTLFVEMLAVAIATAATADNGQNRYQAGYEASGSGGILAAVLVFHLGSFGKFCLIVLALAAIGNNCPNIYSCALAIQTMARWCGRIPRVLWTLLGSCVFVAISIPAYSSFQSVLQNFLDLMSYWTAIYTGIALTDHLIWKRGTNAYDISIYDKPYKLPLGLSAVFAFLCGVAGMIVGMSQTWYVGPVALSAGEKPYGGDVGFELAFLFSVVAYLAARPLEIRFIGR